MASGEILEIYPSVRKAVEAMKKPSSCSGHIVDVCNGKRKTAYGYKWEYVS